MTLRPLGSRAASTFTVRAKGILAGGDFFGTYVYELTGEEKAFSCALQLVAGIEGCLDIVGAIPATHRYRSWQKLLGKHNADAQTGVINMGGIKGQENTPTFVVRVQYRQNATWQGRISWLEGEKEASFRSAIEMLHLMEEIVAQCVESGDQPSEETGWKKPGK